MTEKYIIRSTNRSAPNIYFAAIHGYTPFFSTREKAQGFDSHQEALVFARKQLFADERAFWIEPRQDDK